MQKTLILLLLTDVLGLPLLSSGEPLPTLTSQAVAARCGADAPTFDQGFCLGLIYGVEDNAAFDHKICVPGAVSSKERLAVVLRYIKESHGRDHESFGSLAFDALHERWPCRETR